MTDPSTRDRPTDDSAARPPWTRLDTTTIREASWTTIVAVVVAGAAVTVGFHLAQPALQALVSPLSDATAGLVQLTLLVNLGFVAVIVGGLILGLGRLWPRDIGLVRRDIPVGLAVTAGIWALMQATAVVALLVQGRPLTLDAYLVSVGVPAVVGGFLAQLLGNALYEELVYRGFLVPQFETKIDAAGVGRSPRAVLGIALVTSQLVFTLIHVPGRLAGGVPVAELPVFLVAPFLLGLLFALLYYRTGNLFVVVGIHALVNDPMLVVDAGAVVLVPLLLVVGLLAVRPSLVSGDTPGTRAGPAA